MERLHTTHAQSDRHRIQGDLSPEDVVRQFIREVYDYGNVAVLKGLVAPDFHFQDLESVGTSLEDLELHYAYLHVNWNRIFQTFRFEILDVRDEGEVLTVHLRKTGKFRPEIARKAGQESHQEIRTEAFRVVNGRIKERKIVTG